MIVAQKWRPMADEPTTEEEFRKFVSQEVGRLHADVAKLVAILSLWAQPATARRYRLFTWGIIFWLAALTVALIIHALLSAGLLRI